MLIKTRKQALAKTYFTSDQHFSHANILNFCRRPFDNVQHMDKSLVENWNAKVEKDATVYHLGDFTLNDKKTANEFFSQLNGKINVLGLDYHHDKRWLYEEVYFSGSGAPVIILPEVVILEVTDYNDTGWPLPIVLSHHPYGSWDRKPHGAWHLHGHSHGDYVSHKPEKDLILDVGVDNHPNYAPFSFNEIESFMLAKGNQNV